MIRSEQNIVEWLRGPVVALDETTLVAEIMQLSEEIAVHYFALQRGGKIVGRVCACDLRSAPPSANALTFARPLNMTLSADTPVEAALTVLNAGMDWTIVDGPGGTPLGVVTWHDLQQTLAGFDKTHGYYCNGCGADHCLKQYREHTLLCPECMDRAAFDDWYDIGAAG